MMWLVWDCGKSRLTVAVVLHWSRGHTISVVDDANKQLSTFHLAYIIFMSILFSGFKN